MTFLSFSPLDVPFLFLATGFSFRHQPQVAETTGSQARGDRPRHWDPAILTETLNGLDESS